MLTQRSHRFDPIETPEAAFAPILDRLSCQNEQEKPMTRIKLIGAAIVLSSMIAGPAMAQRSMSHPNYAQSNYCATLEPGNPYSEQYDFQSWSAWRNRGGWDSRGDDACARDPHTTPPQVGF